MTYRYLGRSLRKCGHLAVILSAAALFGCEGKVIEAGDADDTDDSSEGESDTSEQPTLPQTQDPDPNCAAEDAAASANYETWLALDNDFEDAGVSLLGKTFQGYIEGGDDITFKIASDGEAELVIGERVEQPAVKDKGFLCGAMDGPGVDVNETSAFAQCQEFLIEGASYTIRGAQLTSRRLTVPIHENSPYDPWCVLQDPVIESTDENATPCRYAMVSNSAGGWGPEGCWLGETGNEDSVDCGWMFLSGWDGSQVCSCTSSACFAQIYEGAKFTIDARMSDDSSEITGSLVKGEETTPIYLFEVPD